MGSMILDGTRREKLIWVAGASLSPSFLHPGGIHQLNSRGHCEFDKVERRDTYHDSQTIGGRLLCYPEQSAMNSASRCSWTMVDWVIRATCRVHECPVDTHEPVAEDDPCYQVPVCPPGRRRTFPGLCHDRTTTMTAIMALLRSGAFNSWLASPSGTAASRLEGKRYGRNNRMHMVCTTVERRPRLG